MLAAGLLDQLVFVATFVLGLGSGLLLDERGGPSPLSIGLGIALGFLGAMVVLVVQTRLAVRHGSTAGLFLLGVRFDPRVEVHWFEDAMDWLLTYWQNLVLVPVVWLVRTASRDRDDAATGLVPDPRTHRPGARVARAALALLLVAASVPLVLAVLA